MTKKKELTFKVRGWLYEDEFKELISIADYLSREKNASIFKLNVSKIINKGIDIEEVLEILDRVNAEYDSEEITKALTEILGSKEITFKIINNKIVMKPNFYLGSLYDQLKDYLRYDKSSKLFYVKPMYFFTLRRILESKGIRVNDETGISLSLIHI